MNDSNDITVNYAKSPEVKELFSRKNIGDICEFTVRMQVNEKNQDEAQGKMKKITFQSHDGEDEEAKPDAEEPAMIEMEVGGKKMELETAAY